MLLRPSPGVQHPRPLPLHRVIGSQRRHCFCSWNWSCWLTVCVWPQALKFDSASPCHGDPWAQRPILSFVLGSTSKGPSSQGYAFSSGHVWMWELDYKESWAPKNWCFWTVVLEKTLESPLDCKENKPAHPKGNQSCVFLGRTDAEAEAPVLWPPDSKSWLIGKDPDAGKDWRQEEKGTTEDEMVGWHHWLNGHKFG